MIEVRQEPFAGRHGSVVIDCGEDAPSAGVARCVELTLRLGLTELVVDLGARESADSDLLRALHRGGRALRAVDGRLGVVCGSPGLRRLLELTLLSQSFAVYATCAEAAGETRTSSAFGLVGPGH